MNAPDWQKFTLEPTIVPERSTDANRLVLWVPAERDQTFQYWERIGNVARGLVSDEQGVYTTAATAVRARQRLGAGLGTIWHRLVQSKKEHEFALPNGGVAEQCGQRRSDLAIVWVDTDGPALDFALVESRWPDAESSRRLGNHLFVVSGIKPPGMRSDAPAAEQPETTNGLSPREYAEQLLAAARQSGDRQREVTALADFGVTILNEGDAQAAIGHLEKALALAREIGDRAKECDVIGNLGTAMLSTRRPARAAELFQHELQFARATGDRFTEKLALERLGVAAWNIGDFRRALAFFEEALQLTRKLGDRHQEATLLWHQGIQHAELGQRDLAIARAEEAVTLFKLLGKPQAAGYGAYLQKYRMNVTETGPVPQAGAARSPAAYLGGSIVASVVGGQPAGAPATAPTSTSGPGLLRMAMSATKAMAGFAASGFKTASSDVQKKRLQTCAACEHHTGVRCKICGCFTNVKSRMLHEDCPIGKWPQ
jgi:tetratricopeptide (TPR) repeat protein